MIRSHEKMELDIGLNNPADFLKKAEREKGRLLKASQSLMWLCLQIIYLILL